MQQGFVVDRALGDRRSCKPLNPYAFLLPNRQILHQKYDRPEPVRFRDAVEQWAIVMRTAIAEPRPHR